jgi:hypothetical protein
MRWITSILAIGLLAGCLEDEPAASVQDAAPATTDGGSAAVVPDACTPTAFWSDQDDDGLGDRRIELRACDRPVGFVPNADDAEPDCASNDTDACGVCAGPGVSTWFADGDGDGLGDDAVTVVGCTAPVGYLNVGGDPEPDCATNDSDVCGACAGPGELRFWLDADSDGLGDPAVPADACEPIEGFVDNDADPEPTCATNDTDDCGLCAGPGRTTLWGDQDEDGLGDPALPVEVCDPIEGLVANADDTEPECATNDTDGCGVCGGGDAGMDCNGVCAGAARLDICDICAGGDTGVEPAAPEDADHDGIPDACDDCPGSAPARFIVQWTGVQPFVRGDAPAHGPYTFQAVLYQNGSVRFQYRDMQGEHGFGATATVGYQIDAETAVTLSRDNDFVLDQSVVTLDRVEGRYEANYVHPMDWLDITELGVELEMGDDTVVEHDIGFGFAYGFAGARYNSVQISSNGLLTFLGAMPGFQNGGLPHEGTTHLLAPFWDDLNPGAGGTVHVFTAVPACEDDCNGVLGGFAYPDACELCVGGDTGQEPSENVDCNGVCDGDAFIDPCGDCVGGDTGRMASEDCRPDLIVDGDYLAQTLQIDYIDAEDECLINEGCIRALGRRKLIRFGTRIANIGSADLRLGAPREGADEWTWDQCHQHFHYEAYAAYDLYDVANDVMIPIGAKSGFSVIDIGVWDAELAPNGCVGYNGGNQGITAGCQDTYSRSLRCQWVDVTDIEDGEYEVVVTTNPEASIEEVDLMNNSARVRVRMTGDVLELVDP